MQTRTLTTPRYSDEWSFSGRGRWQTRRFEQAAPNTTATVPIEPAQNVAVDPKEPRG